MSDGSSESSALPRLLDRDHRSITVGIVVFITLVAFEGTAVITALPVIARDLDALTSIAWIVNAFVAASLLGQVLAGEAGDRHGPKRPILIGIGIFAVGSLSAGLATVFPVLLLGRAMQGFGAGSMIVAAYLVIARAYDPRLRPKAFGLLSAAWVLPAIVGPVVAGWLADSVSWRWIFLSVLVLMWPPLLLVVPQLRRFDGASDEGPRRSGRARLGVLAAVGLVAVQDGAQRGSWLGLAEAALGLVCLVPALLGLLPTGTLRLARGLPTVIAMRGLLAGAFFAAEAWVPLALQTVRGVSTTWSGMFLACGAVGWAIGAQLQGRALTGWTPPRFVRVGAGLVTLSLLLLPLSMVPSLPPWILGFTWTIGSAGMGLSVSSLATLLLNYSAPGEQGANSASIQVSDSSGVVLITGLTGAMFVWFTANGGAGALAFSALFLTSAVVGIVALVAAPRVRRVLNAGAM